jgi:DNA-binding NarL/FixJ family response regulator
MPKLRILLADDHAILRLGLRQLIDAERDMIVVGEAADGEEAVALAAQLKPAVVVMDLSMPGTTGVDAIRQLCVDGMSGKVLVLTVHEDRGYLREALEAGAAGYILKRAAAEELVVAIRSIGEGQTYIDTRIANELANLLVPQPARRLANAPELTDRELGTLRYIAEGYSNREIAVNLAVSVKTVETYKRRGMKKLGLHSRVDIVRVARERRWPPI